MKRKLTIQNDIEQLVYVNEFLDETGQELQLNRGCVINLNLVLEEALSNVIFYAYPGECDREIEIEIGREGEWVDLVITDSGCAFDPTARVGPDISLAPEERGIGGLGIFLILKIMDKVTYCREEGRNILSMKKRINE